MADRLRGLLEHRIPSDTARQVDVFEAIAMSGPRFAGRVDVLDLGAGSGDAYEKLLPAIPAMRYVGLDIEASAEVDGRCRSDLDFRTYDGVHIPFADAAFDVVFCRQVLEHVRHPDAVIGEVSRVLRPGGLFVGSVSQLEPYHSHSLFNWTALALVEVFGDHGIDVRELRPGIDGVTLTLNRIIKKNNLEAFFFTESLFNHFIDGAHAAWSVWERNFQKLIVAGHIIWIAEKT